MIILLNGPPRSGKDLAAYHIGRMLPNCADFKMSHGIKAALKSLLHLHSDADRHLYDDYKDTPGWLVNDNDTTPRQALIKLSEEYMKPLFGEDIFGHMMVKQLQQSIFSYATISDIGFAAEVRPVIKAYKSSLYCLKLRRPGYDYHDDSRTYIDSEGMGIPTQHINNEFDQMMFREQVMRAVRKWVPRYET